MIEQLTRPMYQTYNISARECNTTADGSPDSHLVKCWWTNNPQRVDIFWITDQLKCWSGQTQNAEKHLKLQSSISDIVARESTSSASGILQTTIITDNYEPLQRADGLVAGQHASHQTNTERKCLKQMTLYIRTSSTVARECTSTAVVVITSTCFYAYL